MAKHQTIRVALVFAFMWLALAGAVPARAQDGGPSDQILNSVGVDQHLDAQVPRDLAFRDESGQAVTLGDYMRDKPTILTLNYFECPNLCTLVLTRLTDAMRELSFGVGKQFNVVTVSIDPRERPELAAAKKATYLERYGKPDAAGGWHFLTGDAPAIERLTQVVGFRYAYDDRQNQYAHPAAILLLTPEGRISRYFYDLSYAPGDLRLGLVEASANQIGSPVDQFLLRCYHYDPVSGRYTPAIMQIVQISFIATALAIGAAVFLMARRGRRLQLGS
jgi:protein SCO1/2